MSRSLSVKMRWFAVLSFLLGFGLMALAIYRGEATLGLFIIFPVFMGSGPLTLLGMLCIFLGFLLFFVAGMHMIGEVNDVDHIVQDSYSDMDTVPMYSNTDRRKSSFGGVVFLGPIPIVFGSSQEMARWMVVAAIVIAVIMLLFFVMY